MRWQNVDAKTAVRALNPNLKRPLNMRRFVMGAIVFSRAEAISSKTIDNDPLRIRVTRPVCSRH